MNKVQIFLAVVLASSAIAMAEQTLDQELDELFKWPSLTHHYDSLSFFKKFQCVASIHKVYSCLRLSFLKFNTQNFQLLHAATDCCTSISHFRERCSDCKIGQFESFLFPPLLFKQCIAGDAAAPGPAPAAAAGLAADIEV
ncbi:unnamed protein product [Lactuca saligna]|uniref:Uncharacterized protein n=1 Tax=Lactuca saligna TaxID=75948 RepID=A0AA36E0J4_LACSI|nr:unnamed protein product [Lactuca saligna]